jgi:hypothetical protein
VVLRFGVKSAIKPAKEGVVVNLLSRLVGARFLLISGSSSIFSAPFLANLPPRENRLKNPDVMELPQPGTIFCSCRSDQAKEPFTS